MQVVYYILYGFEKWVDLSLKFLDFPGKTGNDTNTNQSVRFNIAVVCSPIGKDGGG